MSADVGKAVNRVKQVGINKVGSQSARDEILSVYRSAIPDFTIYTSISKVCQRYIYLAYGFD